MHGNREILAAYARQAGARRHHSIMVAAFQAFER